MQYTRDLIPQQQKKIGEDYDWIRENYYHLYSRVVDLTVMVKNETDNFPLVSRLEGELISFVRELVEAQTKEENANQED